MELKVAITLTDNSAAANIASNLGGTMYTDERADPSGLPFTALVTAVTDDIERFKEPEVHGLYVIADRIIKPGAANVFGLFPMVAHPDLSHTESDAHWRDNHAPLALVHHAFMIEYRQLSIIHRIHGPQYDGFALCGFATLENLKTRFFSEPDSPQVIAQDVAKFADTKRSPRRLIATPHRF